jgi:hypothetical protein
MPPDVAVPVALVIALVLILVPGFWVAMGVYLWRRKRAQKKGERHRRSP